MENNKRPTQAKMALEYMKEHGSITSLEAIQELGIMSFPKRICELEQMGIPYQEAFGDGDKPLRQACNGKALQSY